MIFNRNNQQLYLLHLWQKLLFSFSQNYLFMYLDVPLHLASLWGIVWATLDPSTISISWNVQLRNLWKVGRPDSSFQRQISMWTIALMCKFLLPSYEQMFPIILHFWSMYRGLSRGKIESVFGHFTTFSIRKTDSSQYSIWGKRTLHKIRYEENGLFTKFHEKTDSSQNLLVFMFTFFGGRRTYPPFF